MRSAVARWRLDEMLVKIAGERRWLWRAADGEGVGLNMLVQRRRHKQIVLRPLSKLLKKTGVRRCQAKMYRASF